MGCARAGRETGREPGRRFRKMKNSLVCFPALAKRKRISRVCFPGQKDDVALNLAAVSSGGCLVARGRGGKLARGRGSSGESVSCQHFDKFMRL